MHKWIVVYHLPFQGYRTALFDSLEKAKKFVESNKDLLFARLEILELTGRSYTRELELKWKESSVG